MTGLLQSWRDVCGCVQTATRARRTVFDGRTLFHHLLREQPDV
jgi:hypothetical protein